eukprot:6210025-Pleurochrysis_carterae.AAC.4
MRWCGDSSRSWHAIRGNGHGERARAGYAPARAAECQHAHHVKGRLPGFSPAGHLQHNQES